MKSEKRQFQRISNAIQVKYEVIDSKSKIPLTSYTRDISAGGFLIRLNSPLPINTVIKLKFFIEESGGFIPAEAKIVRVDEVVEGKVYEAGVQLININEKDVELLFKYVINKTN